MSDDPRATDAELDRLYQQLILEHNRDPRGWGAPVAADRRAEADNPFCGDRVVVHARVDGDVIADVGFTCESCAILKASASMMTQSLKGKSKADAERLFREFQDMVTGRTPEGEQPEELGKLAVFAGVREFPARVKCATLAWHTFRAALEGREETVSTE